MLQELLTPDAQEGWHYWASVLLAHAMLGVIMGLILNHFMSRTKVILTVAILYLAWELLQGFYIGHFDWVDIATDWLATMSGCLLVLSVYSQRVGASLLAVVALGWRAAVGIYKRLNR